MQHDQSRREAGALEEVLGFPVSRESVGVEPAGSPHGRPADDEIHELRRQTELTCSWIDPHPFEASQATAVTECLHPAHDDPEGDLVDRSDSHAHSRIGEALAEAGRIDLDRAFAEEEDPSPSLARDSRNAGGQQLDDGRKVRLAGSPRGHFHTDLPTPTTLFDHVGQMIG